MTITRLMLSTAFFGALFGSLALPVLAQPVAGAHQVRATHHRTVRHAPVHRIATSPAAIPDARASATAPAAVKPSVGATATVPVAPNAGLAGTAPAGTTMGAVPVQPRVTTVAPGTSPTVAPLVGTVPAARVTTAPAITGTAKVN